MHIDHPLDRARSNNKLISVSSTTEVLIHRREQAWVLDLSNFEIRPKRCRGYRGSTGENKEKERISWRYGC